MSPTDDTSAHDSQAAAEPKRQALRIFPLPGILLLEGTVLPLHIFEPRYRELVNDAIADDGRIGIVQCDAAERLATVGCIGHIETHRELPDGRYLILLRGKERFRIEQELDSAAAYREVEARRLPTVDSYPPGVEDGDVTVTLEPGLRDVLLREVHAWLAQEDSRLGETEGLSDVQLVGGLAMSLEFSADVKQQILEADTLRDRCLLMTMAASARHQPAGLRN